MMILNVLTRKLAAITLALLMGICSVFFITSALQVMAKDTLEVLVCNEGVVQCVLTSPEPSTTQMTVTKPVPRDRPVLITISVAAPTAEEFSVKIKSLIRFTGAVTGTQEYEVDRGSNPRTAVFTASLPPLESGETQNRAIVEFDLFLSITQSLEAKVIVNYESATLPPTPTATPTPVSVTLPIIQVNYQANYCFTLEDDRCFEPNNTYTTANPTLDPTRTLVFTGSVNPATDKEDFFKVSFTDTIYTISLNPLAAVTTGDLDLFLINVPMQTVACRSSFIGNSTEVIKINVLPCSASNAFSNTTVLPGDYRLRVVYQAPATLSTTVRYTITIAR